MTVASGAWEEATPGKRWGENFKAFVMSAPVDADLLDASSWTRTNALERDPKWLNGKFGGWLEGNAVPRRTAASLTSSASTTSPTAKPRP